MPFPDANLRWSRCRSWATLATSVLLTLAAFGAANADPGNRKTRRSVPATVAHSAPDTTGAIPSNVQPPPSAADTDVLPPPFTLPKVSRARMRACGHKWESMKEAGTTGDDIWRDFATKCLASKDAPVISADGAGDADAEAPAPSR